MAESFENLVLKYLKQGKTRDEAQRLAYADLGVEPYTKPADALTSEEAMGPNQAWYTKTRAAIDKLVKNKTITPEAGETLFNNMVAQRQTAVDAGQVAQAAQDVEEERKKVSKELGIDLTMEDYLTLTGQAPTTDGAVAPADTEVDPTTAALNALLDSIGGDGGTSYSVSDIGPNSMAIQREQMANQLVIEKMQEEQLAKTGERSAVIDLLGDLLTRESNQFTQARDYVDRLISTAGITVPEGMVYNPGSEPGGARDIVRGLAGMTGEPAFPRKIQTTQIPVSMLNQPMPTQPEDVAVAQAQARNISAGVGLKHGGVVKSREKVGKLLGFAGGTGELWLSPESAAALLAGNAGRGNVGGAGDTTAAATDPNVAVGMDELNMDWLMDQIAAQYQLDYAKVSGYMPTGAPTLEMQQLEDQYKQAVDVASIYSKGSVESAQASAAATQAAAALAAAASRYAAELGLQGDEIAAAAQKYVADVQARTAAERLSFEKTSKQAELASNPRTLFQSVFLNRGLNAPATVNDLQNQITPPGTFAVPGAIQLARGGGPVYGGPIVARVGERSKKSKTHETDEYALLAPGSVIAPRRKGEQPTMRNAVSAIFNQVAKSNTPAAKVPGTAAGTVVPQADPWVDYFSKAGKGLLPSAAGGLSAIGWPGPDYPLANLEGALGVRGPSVLGGRNFLGGVQAPRTGFSFATARGAGEPGSINAGAMFSKDIARQAAALGHAAYQAPVFYGGRWISGAQWNAPDVVGGQSGMSVWGKRPPRAGRHDEQPQQGYTPAAVVAPAPVGTPIVPDIGVDVLPAELLEAPAYGAPITSSLVRPRALRGAFGKTRDELSNMFNALSTNVYDLAKLTPEELLARQDLLSTIGITPETYLEAAKRATLGAYGSPLTGVSSLARQAAGRLLS